MQCSLSYKSLKSRLQFRCWQYGSIFICLAVVAYQICEISQNSERIRTYSSSRSSKVIDLGVNRKCICDFLLLINSNFSRILCFTVFATLTFKARKWPTPPLFDASARGNPLEFLDKIYPTKTRGIYTVLWKLHNLNFNSLWLIHPCNGQTDGRTLSRAKKWNSVDGRNVTSEWKSDDSMPVEL